MHPAHQFPVAYRLEGHHVSAGVIGGVEAAVGVSGLTAGQQVLGREPGRCAASAVRRPACAVLGGGSE